MKKLKKIRFPAINSTFVLLAVVIVVGVVLYTSLTSWRSYEGTIGRTLLSSDILFTYEITKYEANAIVTQPVEVNRTMSIGVATDTDKLKFGEIPAGRNYAMRELSLSNLEDTPAKISISAKGSISPHLQFRENNFILPGKSNTTIKIFFMADGANIGNYDGEVLVEIKRPKFPALGMLE
jgi:hypothetical protein